MFMADSQEPIFEANYALRIVSVQRIKIHVIYLAPKIGSSEPAYKFPSRIGYDFWKEF